MIERWGVLGDLHPHPLLIRKDVLRKQDPKVSVGNNFRISVKCEKKQNSPTVQRALMCVGRSHLHSRNLVV